MTTLSRIATILKKYPNQFKQRILTNKEQALAKGKEEISYVASRFAAKEAAVKALGTGFVDGISFLDIEVLIRPSGQPYLEFHGKAKTQFLQLNILNAHLTITHTREIAGAVVVLEK